MRKPLKKTARAPRVMITDKLRSTAAAKKGLNVEHRQGKGTNNRAANSYQPHATTGADHEVVQIFWAGAMLLVRR